MQQSANSIANVVGKSKTFVSFLIEGIPGHLRDVAILIAYRYILLGKDLTARRHMRGEVLLGRR